MTSAYMRAVAITDELLSLRNETAFPLEIGDTRVTAAPQPDLTAGVRLENSGEGLKITRWRISLPQRRGVPRTELYISAGPRSDSNRVHVGFPEGTHYLYVHDREGRKALQLPMQQVVPEGDEPVLLTVAVRLNNDGSEAVDKLIAWLTEHGYEFQEGRFVLGPATNPQRVLTNLLTIALLKQHLRGYFVLPDFVDELPPRGADASPQEFEVVFRDYESQRGFEINRINSEKTPPNQVPFRVDVGEKSATMWVTRFDASTKAINTCEGDYISMADLRDVLGLHHGEHLRMVPVAVRHYRLERLAQGDYPVGLFMRLGQTLRRDEVLVDGFGTMASYRAEAHQKGYTWFATHSLATGMSAERVTEFKQAIERGAEVTVYFMIGVNGGGNNQIEFTAHLMDLASSAELAPCPEGEGCPDFPNQGRIWLKLKEVAKHRMDPNQFVVDDRGTNLADAVAKGQYQFGYIRRMETEPVHRPDRDGDDPDPVPGPRPLLTEAEVVEKLARYLLESGFRFTREMLLNYWISLKTKPFVILAGLSGSGKSKLPMLVARALGAEFARIAVSPGWTEDSDLLGYRNPLDPSGAFQVTDFAAFLLAARRDTDDRLWFACLDEMNLARVEHYFAKFLSAMEGLGPSDRLVHLHSGTDSQVPQSVPVPPAFFFTGTVNMDETTHTFSPKVLDRANLIEFDVAPEELLEDLPPMADPGWSIGLTYQNFQQFCPGEGYKAFRPELVKIAEILQPVRAHFGFRVREEIERYIAGGLELMAPQDLFDLQIHQKILPKVRGSGTTLEGALGLLGDLCAEKGWQRSAAKVQEMLERLRTDGITHFYR